MKTWTFALVASTTLGAVRPAHAQSAASDIVVPEGCRALTDAQGQVTISCAAQPPAAPAASPTPAVSPPTAVTPSPVAAPAPAYAPPIRRKVSTWYGWQTLIVDGSVVLASAVVGPTSDSFSATSALFLGGYLLGGPIVHFAHGEVGKGFGSLGLRVVLPLAGGVTGGLIGVSTSDGDGFAALGSFAGGASIGVLVGAAGAILIDVAALAHEEKIVEEPARSGLRLVPSAGYDPRRQAFSAGLGGTF